MTKKSPAFNFYSSDFLTETTFMTNEQVGAYIRLLCYQHQFEYLSKEQILSVTKDEIVLGKFREKNGKFFNENLKEIIDKKKAHCNKQRENILKRWGKNKDTMVLPSYKNGTPSGNDLVIPLENVIVIENNNKKEDIYTFIENNYSRTISSYEYQLLDNWLKDYSEELIIKAFEISIKNNAKNFNYVEGILKNWKAEGIKSIEDIQAQIKNQKKEPEWFNQNQEAQKMTFQEQKELEEMMKEFK